MNRNAILTPMLQKEEWGSGKLSDLPEANNGEVGGASGGEVDGARTTTESPQLPAPCT